MAEEAAEEMGLVEVPLVLPSRQDAELLALIAVLLDACLIVLKLAPLPV